MARYYSIIGMKLKISSVYTREILNEGVVRDIKPAPGAKSNKFYATVKGEVIEIYLDRLDLKCLSELKPNQKKEIFARSEFKFYQFEITS